MSESNMHWKKGKELEDAQKRLGIFKEHEKVETKKEKKKQ